MAAKFFTGLPLDGPDPECVQGFGEAALASVSASPGLPVPRPSADHSHRTVSSRFGPSRPAPSGAAQSGPRAAGGPVPVSIARRRPPAHDCDESPLAGFEASAPDVASGRR
jgi:hypothetical protein